MNPKYKLVYTPHEYYSYTIRLIICILYVCNIYIYTSPYIKSFAKLFVSVNLAIVNRGLIVYKRGLLSWWYMAEGWFHPCSITLPLDYYNRWHQLI